MELYFYNKGYGRFHYLDSAKFCSNARGSLNESLDHLNVAADEFIAVPTQGFLVKAKNNDWVDQPIRYYPLKETVEGYMKLYNPQFVESDVI